jgi:probable rRNA maturation factor
MLHILGYDHEMGGVEAMHMRDNEDSIMTSLGYVHDIFEL